MWAQQRQMQEQMSQHQATEPHPPHTSQQPPHNSQQPPPPLQSDGDRPPLPNEAAPHQPPPPVQEGTAPFVHSERLKKIHEEENVSGAPPSWSDQQRHDGFEKKDSFGDNDHKSHWKPFGNLDYAENVQGGSDHEQGKNL